MKPFRGIFYLLITIVCTVSIVIAQDVCSSVAQDALQLASDSCSDISRNQVCYGYNTVQAIGRDAVDLNFDAPGDMLDVEQVESLTLAGFDQDSGTWGIALMSLQADISDTLPGQNVTVLLFGDVEYNSQTQDGTAFIFRSGIGSPDCEQAPSGMLVQTPEGVGEISLTMNNVQISLGSTAFVMAEPEGDLTFALLEGNSTVTANDKTVDVSAGQFTTIALNEDLLATGTPTDPETLEGTLQLPQLPLHLLPTNPNDVNSDQQGNTTSEVIIPRSGTWIYTRGSVEAEGCPPGMAGILEQNSPISQTAFVDFGGQAFDMEAFMTEQSPEPLPGGDFSNPEPNVYQYTYSEQGSSFTYELHFISETRIEGQVSFGISDSGMNCSVSIPFVVVNGE